MVRATRKIRSWLRAVRPMRRKADSNSFSPALSRVQNRPAMAGVIWALQEIPVPAKRLFCWARAASTRSLTAAEDSGVSRRRMASNSTEGTSTWRSIRSSRGPEMRLTYFSTMASVQAHRPEGWPRQPQRQGFIAATSIKRLGRRRAPAARVMVTSPSSMGWRRTSRASLENSGSSSKNSTPLWAREISPGLG